MRGSAAVFVLGMIVAAIVGIAAAFAMQTAMLDGFDTAGTPGSTDHASNDLKIELTNTEQRLQSKIEVLAGNIEELSGSVEGLRADIRNLKLQAPVAVSDSGEAAAPVVAGNIGEAINRVLDDRDKRRDEEREQERAQRTADMRERFKGMMVSRTERYGEEKGWDTGKTDQVKSVMSEYYEKMSEISPMGFMGRGRGGRGGDRGGTEETREQINQLREDTKNKLLQLVSEEEANELLQGGFGGGRGRPGGGRDR
jgi:predicted RNase H-like nuclease (RuvC/YqgF family)